MTHMALGLVEKIDLVRMGLVGCDYITALGLSQILRDDRHLEVVSDTEDEPWDLLERGGLDIVLVDSGTDGALLQERCTRLLAVPKPPLVVVLGELSYRCQEQLLLLGVTAILDVGRIAEDFPALLRIIQRGGALIMNGTVRDVFASRSHQIYQQQKERLSTLTMRERRMVDCVAEGLSNAEISAQMHLSQATVKQVISTVIAKLGVENRVQVAVAVTKANFV